MDGGAAESGDLLARGGNEVTSHRVDRVGTTERFAFEDIIGYQGKNWGDAFPESWSL